MSNAHIFIILVEDKFFRLLVYGIVSQMHADIFHVLLIRGHIILSCETTQTVSKDKHSQWIYSRN
jgi:hypothetical protein